MHQPDEAADTLYTTRIPADISRPDRLLGPFTARQTAVLTVAALALYGGWWAARPFMTPLAYVVLVIPVAGAVAALALGRREGIGLDHFLLCALAHARASKRRVHAPEGVPPLPAVVPGRWATAAGPPPDAMRMPYDGITSEGVLDLDREGKAALATCSTVNFELRSAAEQQGLTAAFARWLNSLTGPTQLLVRCHRIDLAPLADLLQHDAAALPHSALERAARAHADFLTDLAAGGNLLGRQIVLVAREDVAAPGGRRHAGEGRVRQRVAEAARALAAAEITVTALDAEQSAELVGAACNPDTPTPPEDGPESEALV
ncbi:PrgI family protein [Streptomyces sp. NPDC046942]|uniref:PrgI family protein n=1 Tax=Streptomyces sp. NPDC046942 TaxID=3155137 RepID=UPI00340198ED